MLNRRDFIKSASAALAAGPVTPELLLQRTTRPVVISDYSGLEFRNGGKENAVDRAFRLITEGTDVLDALIAGVNIPELDPTRDGYRLRRAAERRRRRRARRLVHARADEAGRCGSLPAGRAHAVARRPGGDGLDRPSSAGGRRGAAVRAQLSGFKIEDDLNTENVAKAVARMEAPRRSRALARSERRGAQGDSEARERPGRGGRIPGACARSRESRWCATGSSQKAASGAPSTATASVRTAISAASPPPAGWRGRFLAARATRRFSALGSTSITRWAPRDRRGEGKPISTTSPRF